jgi:uncharacterized membrane protein YccC
MSHAPALQRLAGFWRQGRWRPGAQLGTAVALAWGVSTALHLPESFWSVMSVLIVMRPSSGATLDAGWDRVRGTAAGALCGLAGIALQHHGVPTLPSTLAIALLLSVGGAGLPGLRSAPIAALIVLSAEAIPGHSALQVALLRMVQIGIGVGVALAVSTFLSEYRAGARFDTGCATLLRGLAQRMARMPRPAPAEAERAEGATRAALGRLALLAASADLEARWWRRGAEGRSHACRDRARLMARVFQDAVVLDRVLRLAQDAPADPAWQEAVQAASAAVAGMADAMAGRGGPDLAPLTRLATTPATPSHAMLAAPLGLLLDDLRHMSRGLTAPAARDRDTGFNA